MARDVVLEKHHQQGGRLNQFVGEQGARVGDAARQAMRSGSILGVVRGAFAEQGLRPRQRLRLAWVYRSLREPYTREVRFTIRGSRRCPRWCWMWTSELYPKFPAVAQSAQLVFEQMNIQAQR